MIPVLTLEQGGGYQLIKTINVMTL